MPTNSELAETDNELLMQFARRRSEQAFRQLVERHASLVMGVWLSAALSIAAIALRRRFPRGDELIGEWTVLEYVFDGNPSLTMARDVCVAITPGRIVIQFRFPDMTEHEQSYLYTVRSWPVIDIRNSDDTGTFEGVYHLDRDRLTLAWDTVGKGRPSTTAEADRFGLNRMTLRRT